MSSPIWIGARVTVPAVKVSAVAYAANPLPKSSSIPPSTEGSRTGMPTYRQYLRLEAPRFSAASRHAGRSPPRAGVITSTMSGIWKYR